MAIKSYGAGNWGVSIGGKRYSLPEFGLTEKVGGNPTSLYNATNTKYRSGAVQGPVYNGPTSNKSSGSSGSVLGSSSGSGSKGSYNDLQSLEQDARGRLAEEQGFSSEQRRQILNDIDSAYNPFYEGIQQRESMVPQEEADLNSLMSAGYDEQRGMINRGQETALADLGNAQNNVYSYKKQSLRDIGNDFGNAMSAANQRLGSVGASDSSAANMYGYALGKQATRRGADVSAQAGNQLAQIDLKRNETIRGAQDKLASVETWKANKTQEIGQYIRSLRQEIMSARNEVDARKGEARANLAMQGYQEALGRLQQINDMVVNTKAQIMKEARQQANAIDSYRQQLVADAQYTPTEMGYDPFTTGDASFQSQVTSKMAPMTYANTTDDERQRRMVDLYSVLS